jgi:hypothetical protein
MMLSCKYLYLTKVSFGNRSSLWESKSHPYLPLCQPLHSRSCCTGPPRGLAWDCSVVGCLAFLPQLSLGTWLANPLSPVSSIFSRTQRCFWRVSCQPKVGCNWERRGQRPTWLGSLVKGLWDRVHLRTARRTCGGHQEGLTLQLSVTHTWEGCRIHLQFHVKTFIVPL